MTSSSLLTDSHDGATPKSTAVTASQPAMMTQPLVLTSLASD